MHSDVQFGQLRIRLHAYTTGAVDQVHHFLAGVDFPHQPLLSEAQWSLTIVTPEMSKEEQIPPTYSEEQRIALNEIHRKWASACGGMLDVSPASGLKAIQEVVVSLGTAASGWDVVSADHGILRWRQVGLEPRDFLLLSIHESAGIRSDIWSYRCLFLMSAWWHAYHSSLYVHAAAIAGDCGGFLFLGESGAGKSTAAAMGARAGGKVLADDGAIVLDRGGGYSLTVMPRYPSQFSPCAHLLPLLRAVFVLVKDDVDQIVPVSQRLGAQMLYQSFLANNLGMLISDTQVLEAAYHVACDIARSVPGYELHFRKRPDFWSLINERFPV